jgi:FkbM family methyltransferase
MMTALATGRNVLRSLGKLYAGSAAAGGHARAAGNVAQALGYLAGRKLALDGERAITLGHNGAAHRFVLSARSDMSVLEEIFLDHEYALDIPSPDVILDLGANFGAATIYFAQKWPEARIIAVEPTPATFARLKENTAGYPQVICLNCAVGGHDGMAEFIVSKDHIGSSLFRDDTGGERVQVALRSLPSLMHQFGVAHADLVKFDVEGAEEDLFADPGALARVSTLIGEVHRDLMRMPEAEFMTLFRDFDTRIRSENGDLFVMSANRRAA